MARRFRTFCSLGGLSWGTDYCLSNMGKDVFPNAAPQKSFSKSMAGKCNLQACVKMAEPRKAELDQFLFNLDAQSFAGKAL